MISLFTEIALPKAEFSTLPCTILGFEIYDKYAEKFFVFKFDQTFLIRNSSLKFERSVAFYRTILTEIVR